MEKFDFENTTIFKELNELSSEEIKKWVEFILNKNFETEGEYFSNKIGNLKPEGGFKFESSSDYKGNRYYPKGETLDSFFGDEFVCHMKSPYKVTHTIEIDGSYYYPSPNHDEKGIEIRVSTNNEDSIETLIIHRKQISKKIGFLKKIIVDSEEGHTEFSLHSHTNFRIQRMFKEPNEGYTEMSSDGLSFLSKVLDNSKYEFVVKFIKHYNSLLESTLIDYRESIKKEKELEEELLRIKNEKIQEEKEKNELDRQKTSEKKDSIIKELDKDSDGTLDIVQTDDFHEILKKYEKNIIQIDRDYIKNFVKLSNYLKTIRNNLQNTFEILSKVEFSRDLEPLTKILKNKIHTYNSLLLHSLSMVVSLTKDEMITFYEIYEIFDELNVFDSKHEKDMLNGIKSINSELGSINSELGEVNKNLKDVGGKLGDISGQFYSLMEQMKESDERIINSIDNLTYTTSSSIQSLSNTVQSELNSINSSIKFNNLLTGIQTYQMYKVNTKSLKR